jgi:hypothetical protein
MEVENGEKANIQKTERGTSIDTDDAAFWRWYVGNA